MRGGESVCFRAPELMPRLFAAIFATAVAVLGADFLDLAVALREYLRAVFSAEFLGAGGVEIQWLEPACGQISASGYYRQRQRALVV